MKTFKELKPFLILWSTQSLSRLGSAMTGFALTLWLYETTGSALKMALASVCSYGPYVLMSIFAGALSDRWDKRGTLLASDTFAALCTGAVLVLYVSGSLRPWHLYLLNALNGLMNTVQSPAGDVALTLLTPKAHYQRVSGLKSFSNSLATILHPLLATALFSASGLPGVICADLGTFLAAFLALLFLVRIPAPVRGDEERRREPLPESVRSGLAWLRENGLVLRLILFLSGVNLIASAFDAALPPYVLSRENGGEAVLGAVTACAGFATLGGSILVTLLPPPRDRVRAITASVLFSLGAENLILAFARTPALWCLAQIAGWSVIPLMNANMDVILRTEVPVEMQGRVFSCRNSLQFFTIPLGTLLGGFLVDRVCEPLMARASGLPALLLGTGHGSGAALVMLVLGVSGVALCLAFRRVLRGYRFPSAET